MNTFLPKDYKVPQSSGKYMKFTDGQNKFLPLGSIILGFEYWTADNKPVRVKEMPKTIPADIRIDKDGNPSRIKHFWAFPVWNANEKQVQVLEITQKTIMGSIQAFVENEDWGDPIMKYFITVNRSGDGLDTEYVVTPSPQKDIDAEIIKSWEDVQKNGFDLNELFASGDPFNPSSGDNGEDYYDMSE